MVDRASDLNGPVVVIGSAGMLGGAWMRALSSTTVPHRGLDIDDVDIMDAESLRREIHDTDGTVINCAAWTDVDGAESNEAGALAVNGTGPGLLAERCREIGATLVHYSTDYVFDGQGETPWRIDDRVRPIGAYGRTKAEGERLIGASGCDHLILRTSWLYAPWGKNFVRTIATLAGERDELKIVSDQVGRPTSAVRLVETSCAMLSAGARGVHHACDGGSCSWYEFGQEIVRLRGTSCRVSPCSTDEFPRPAPRPAYSVLDLTETESLIGPVRDWRRNLEEAMAWREPVAS